MLLISALLTPFIAACNAPGSEVTLVSYKDPYFPEPLNLALNECVYRYDADGDAHIVGRSDTPPGSTGGQVTQILHVQIYWRPHPGKSHVERSTTNALLRYTLGTETGVAEYFGTGFAYPKEKRDERLVVELESAYLRLESLEGQVADLLGDMRVSGKLIATHTPARAAELLRVAELMRTLEVLGEAPPEDE
jgi:hypothetical protein